ncbi:MAG: tetratricopeptide repeat protein [Methylocella sp.]
MCRTTCGSSIRAITRIGAGHPHSALTLHTLAEIRRAQARFAEAEALYRRALEIRERAFGREHPESVATRVALYALYRGQGRRADAEALFR